jgi:hypothetical protein
VTKDTDKKHQDRNQQLDIVRIQTELLWHRYILLAILALVLTHYFVPSL